jgi:hypothetical protein
MTSKRNWFVALAVVAIVGACDSDDLITTPGLLNKLFNATLTPAAEVPPVTGVASSGTATMTIIDTNTIRIQTKVTAIDSVTQAHIHRGDATVAGPIMVFLAGTFPASQGSVAKGANNTTTLTGVLSHVDITRGVTAFQGAFTFDSLMFHINNGTAYVNVHTRKNPGGEIRGQLTPQ